MKNTIIWILVVVVLVGGGVWYWQSRQAGAPVVSNIPSVPVTQMEDGVESDPTADWKTYTNTKYGFEVKYPGGAAWMVTEEGDYSDRAQFSFSDTGLYDILGVQVAKGKSLQDLKKISVNAFDQEEYGFQVKETSINVSGLLGTKLVVSNGIMRDERVFFQVGNNVFVLTLIHTEHPELFEPFYNSFRLTK